MSDVNNLLDLNNADKEKKKQAALKVKRYRELKDLKEVLSLPEGRRVWRRLLEECGPFRNPYAGDAYLTHVNIGKQDIGQWAMREMDEARPNTYLEMSREYKSDVLRDQKIHEEIQANKENT